MSHFYHPGNLKVLELTGRYILIFMLLLFCSGLQAQTVSGTWDAANTTGATGYINRGSGVIQLLDVNNGNGCQAAAVHETSSTFNPATSDFNKCYKVFFGCPGDDEMISGNAFSDTKGDGMAFSFWRNSASYNINNGACGGGLGYHGAASDGAMFTIEFDTYSSRGSNIPVFDGLYGGGTTGNHDEISLHINHEASDNGLLVNSSVDAGNLEDGLEHTICIQYVRASTQLTVSIDGNTLLTYTYDLGSYFGSVGLNQTWSSGKYGATNPATVTDNPATSITSVVGAPLCPAGVVITSPSNGATFSGCSVGPIEITATATPPAGNTVTKVEFYVDGALIGTDFSATNSYEFEYTWPVPTNGSHSLTAIAYYSGGGTSTSTANTITVGGGLQLTSTAPNVTDGTVQTLWNSYTSYSMTQGFNSAPDLAGSYKVMYNSTHLFLLVDVTDEDLRNNSVDDWRDDGVEIFIDIGNDKAGSYGGNDFQYGFKYNDGAPAEYKHGAVGGVSFSQIAKAGGYIMEISIPWSTVGLPGGPTAGNYIGFDVKINDDDNDGDDDRDNELAWNDGSFGAWNNPSLFGTHQFTNCDPLPVTLINFTGTRLNDVVVLNWTTSEEINNKMFVIERTSDLSSWEVIGEVEGEGNYSYLRNYSFTDYEPLNGITYYRLRQVDFDGASTVSSVVVINNSDVNQVMIAPNPFEESITITTSLKGELAVSIYDVLGRLLYQENTEIENGSLILQPDLASGAYVITVQTENFMEQQKIVKK